MNSLELCGCIRAHVLRYATFVLIAVQLAPLLTFINFPTVTDVSSPFHLYIENLIGSKVA
jgi:hypothetical protein